MEAILECLAQPGVTQFVSFLALFVSVIGLALGLRNNRREHTTQQRLLTIEEERHKESHKAKLRAYVLRDRIHAVLVIRNDGDSAAENIDIVVDDVHITQNPLIHRNQEHELDIERVGPHSEVRFNLSYEPESPWNVVIEWDGRSSERGIFRTTLQ